MDFTSTLLSMLLLWTSYAPSASEWPIKKRSIVDGDLFLGGFFPVHSWDNELICGQLQDEGLINLQAMLYAVEGINEDSRLLPGIRLGVIAVDSCDSVPRALEEAIDFAKGIVIRTDTQKPHNDHPFTCGAGTSVLPHFETDKFEKVAAIIGGQSSWVSRQVADLMKIYRMPQVSYQSTNPALSEIGYEYFFRTVPVLNFQIKAILEILKQFNWTYIAVVYADSDYGNLGFLALSKLVANYQTSLVGFSSHQRINVENAKAEDYDTHVSELVKRNATAVIVFGDHEMARNLMSAATRAKVYRRFVWIGSTGWVGRKYVVSGNEGVLEGAIGIIHDLKPFKGFNDYLKSRQLKSHSEINPWYPEYWEKHLHCKLKSFDETPFNGQYNQTCSEGAQLPASCYSTITPIVQFIRDAVYSVAQALHNMYTKECNGDKTCFLHQSMNGTKLRDYLRAVEFKDENENLFRFDSDGDGPPRYTVVNLQRRNESGDYYWVPVGAYREENDGEPRLELDKSKMKYKSEMPEFPESRCSEPCSKGQAKIILDGKNFCWHCRKCMDYEFVENGIQCSECPWGTLPNNDRNGCKLINAEYMHFSNNWAICCLVFSVLGILTTLLVAIAVGKFWDTPIIKSSSREFNYILLIGILLSFSLTFGIVSRPSDVSCAIVRYCLGLFYTIPYATIAVKIHYLNRIFKRVKANKKPKSIKIKPLLLIILALIVVEGTINATWLLHSPPSTEYQHPTRRERILICQGSDSKEYLVGLVFPFFLMMFCTAYGFRIRLYTGIFYEARYINFANYTTCMLWLAFIPVFVFNSITSLRIVILSLLLNVTALAQLVCLFLPKIYIAIRRPEKNKITNFAYCDVRQSGVNTSL